MINTRLSLRYGSEYTHDLICMYIQMFCFNACVTILAIKLEDIVTTSNSYFMLILFYRGIFLAYCQNFKFIRIYNYIILIIEFPVFT